MPVVFEHIQGNVVMVRVSGTLTDEDYKTIFLPTMEEKFRVWTGVRMLFIMDEHFHGWDLHGAWDELRFEVKHRNDVVRVGVVGGHLWEAWATRLSRLFTGAKVRFFEHDDLDAARVWITSGFD